MLITLLGIIKWNTEWKQVCATNFFHGALENENVNRRHVSIVRTKKVCEQLAIS